MDPVHAEAGHRVGGATSCASRAKGPCHLNRGLQCPRHRRSRSPKRRAVAVVVVVTLRCRGHAGLRRTRVADDVYDGQGVPATLPAPRGGDGLSSPGRCPARSVRYRSRCRCSPTGRRKTARTRKIRPLLRTNASTSAAPNPHERAARPDGMKGQYVRSQRLAIIEYARQHDFRIDDYRRGDRLRTGFREAPPARRAAERPPARRPPDRERTLPARPLAGSDRRHPRRSRQRAGVAFVALKENIRVEVMTTLFALFAEVERDPISERTREGLAKARPRAASSGARRARRASHDSTARGTRAGTSSSSACRRPPAPRSPASPVPPSAHHEPLDPVPAAGRVDLQVQAVPVAVASGVGDVAHEQGRECVVGVSPVRLVFSPFVLAWYGHPLYPSLFSERGGSHGTVSDAEERLLRARRPSFRGTFSACPGRTRTSMDIGGWWTRTEGLEPWCASPVISRSAIRSRPHRTR